MRTWWRRAATYSVVAAALAGCTQDGLNPIARAGADQIIARVRPGPDAPATPPATLTRQDIEALGVATIRLRLVEGERGALFYSAVENGGVTVYVTQLRESVGLRGSQVVLTRGLGTDLLRATSSPEDPLARPVPPAQWPARVERTFELPAHAPRGRVERYECTFSYGEARTIAILTVEHEGVEITETCRGPDGEFQNLHFADLRTGFVWRSIQWTGPQQGLVDFEVIVPRS
jgi:hypothetical protein